MADTTQRSVPEIKKNLSKTTGKVNIKPSELGTHKENAEGRPTFSSVRGVCSVCGCENYTYANGGKGIAPIMSIYCNGCGYNTPHTVISVEVV